MNIIRNLSGVFVLMTMLFSASCQKGELAQPNMYTDKAIYEIAQEGGNVVIKLKATRDWTSSVSPATSLDNVEGITVTPASGKASAESVEVTVSAVANTEYDRTAIVSFIAENVSVAVTVSQKGLKQREPEKLTVAEFLEKTDDPGIWYELTGTISNITNETYGNFNLIDETGKVLVYGLTDTKQGSNNKSFSTIGLKEGDILTLKGTRSSYNGTPQVGGPAYYVSHEAGAVVGPTSATIAEFLAAEEDGTKYKVTGFIKSISVSEQYGNADIVIMDGFGNEFKLFRAIDTTEDKITDLLTLKVMDQITAVGSRSSYNDSPQMPQGCKVESFVKNTEVSISEFLEAAESDDVYYRVKGTLKAIADGDISASHKNANLTITDGTKDLYLFRMGPGISGFKIEELGLAEGKMIEVVGLRKSYNGNPQMSSGQFIQFVTE